MPTLPGLSGDSYDELLGTPLLGEGWGSSSGPGGPWAQHPGCDFQLETFFETAVFSSC